MTEQNNEMAIDNQTKLDSLKENNSTENSNKKPSYLLLKILIIVILAFFTLIIYKNIQIKNAVETKQIVIKNEAIKESELLEIADDEKYSTTLHDLNVSEIKEKGAEFVYQLLIKNQVQIEDLNNQLRTIKNDLVKLKNQEKFNRLVFNYIELREKLFNGEKCKTEIEGYELLTMNDDFLRGKFATIKDNYLNLLSHEQLNSAFKEVTKQLIINENYVDEQANFVEKIRHNFKKLVVIRKTDKANSSQLEALILDIENALNQHRYQDALTLCLTLDKIYFPIIQKFLENLHVAVEIDNTDKEIIKYFKSLT